MNESSKKACAELSAYLDGQLSESRARKIGEAVETDAELKAELDSLRATRELIGLLPREGAPAGMLETVLEHVERVRLLGESEQPHVAKSYRWVRHLATAAIVLLTVGLGVYLYSVFGPPTWIQKYPSPELADRGEDEMQGEPGGSGEFDGLKSKGGPGGGGEWADSAVPGSSVNAKGDRGVGDGLLARGGRGRVPGPGEGASLLVVREQSMLVNTSDVIGANEEILGYLFSNGIVVEDAPVELNRLAQMQVQSKVQQAPRQQQVGNFARQNSSAPNVEIEVWVPDDQAGEIVDGLAKNLTANIRDADVQVSQPLRAKELAGGKLALEQLQSELRTRGRQSKFGVDEVAGDPMPRQDGSTTPTEDAGGLLTGNKRNEGLDGDRYGKTGSAISRPAAPVLMPAGNDFKGLTDVTGRTGNLGPAAQGQNLSGAASNQTPAPAVRPAPQPPPPAQAQSPATVPDVTSEEPTRTVVTGSDQAAPLPALPTTRASRPTSRQGGPSLVPADSTIVRATREMEAIKLRLQQTQSGELGRLRRLVITVNRLSPTLDASLELNGPAAPPVEQAEPDAPEP